MSRPAELPPDVTPSWTRTVLSPVFVSESAAFVRVAGEPDRCLAGGFLWSTDGRQHERIRTVADAWLPSWGGGRDRVDPHAHLREASGNPPQYKACTYDWQVRPAGLTADAAVLSIGMHTDPVGLHVRRDGRWRRHEVVPAGIHESAQPMADAGGELLGLVTVPRKPVVSWYEPGPDPLAPWTEHLVGEAGGNWHGLGVCALDGSGQPAILTLPGVYEIAGDDRRRPWRWTPLRQVDEHGDLSDGLADACVLHGHDFGDRRTTLFGGSPHGHGLWRWDLEESGSRGRTYRRTTLLGSVSQVHALAVVPALASEPVDAWVVAGKRRLAHGRGHDCDWDAPPVLFLAGVRADPAQPPLLTLLDTTTGVGLRIDWRRLPTGQLQVVTSNKTGAYLYTEGSGGDSNGQSEPA